MLSIKSGNKIFSRLVDLCDGEVNPSKVDKLSDEQIKSIGTASSKVSYIRSITEDVLTGELNFDSLNMYLIFVLNRMDILLTNDAAFLQSYGWLYKTTDRSEITIRNKCKK